MTVILEQYELPHSGTFEIRQAVTIHFSAEEARRRVDRWARQQVSHMFGTSAPALLVGERTLWRVPIHFSAPHVGVVGQVGEVEVDALTGDLLDLDVRQAQLEQQARGLAATLPPYKPHRNQFDTPTPQDVPAAPQLILNDDGEPTIVDQRSD